MSLRLESAPRGAGEAVDRCSLVLLGFRNDLARLRAVAFLQQQAEVAPMPSDFTLPYPIGDAIEARAGERIAAGLDRLGAIVRLTRLDQAPSPSSASAVEPFADEPIVGTPVRRSLLPGRNLRLLVIVGIGAFLIVRQLHGGREVTIPFTPPPPRGPRAAAPAKLQPARAPASTAQVRRLIADNDLAGAQDAVDRLFDDGGDAVAFALQGDIHGKHGDWPAARTAYERSIELGGEDPAVFLALSGIYRQQGMQTQAVDMLHRAQQSGARGQDFEQMKQVVVAEQDAESGFDSMTSAHFSVSFDGAEDNDAAQLILSQLEDAYMVVGHKLGEYPGHRTPAVLYSARDFQQVTHSPGWAGALYDGRIKIPVRGVQNDPALAKTIRHEYAHSLIMTLSGGKCPVWLNEGVAMWAEEEREGEREEWANAALQLQKPFTLAQLESSFMHLSSTQAATAYAQSYLAARRIVARYGDRSLRNLLIAFATTDSTAAAFREALPVELSSFEDELRGEQGGG